MAKPKQPKSEEISEILQIQIKMARAALGWSIRDLMEKAKVSNDTVNRLERGEQLRERTLAAVRDAMESAGVVFIAENGGGPGVRLKRKPKRSSGGARKASVLRPIT
jgi:transcriptional regulator with XRE-family HTH domain